MEAEEADAERAAGLQGRADSAPDPAGAAEAARAEAYLRLWERFVSWLAAEGPPQGAPPGPAAGD